MTKIFTRFGDGTPVELSEKEIMEDLHAGMEDAADRADVSQLTDDDLKFIYELLASPHKFVSVEPGKEVILTYDAGTLKIRRVGVNVDRIQALQIYEKIMGADSKELCHVDYSYKPIKPIVTMEQPIAGLRDRFITMVGGAPCTPRWAARIGADAYAKDAQDGVIKVKELIEQK